MDAVTIEDCRAWQGGAISSSTADVESVDMIDNEAKGVGGGAMYEVSGDITRCRMLSNSATSTLAATSGRGGALYRCDGEISNCIIADNFAETDGGGLFDCDGPLRNLTVAFNHADDQGGGARKCNGSIRNCIFWDNTAVTTGANGDQLSKCSLPKYCGFRTWTGGGGNHVKTNTPHFVDISSTNPVNWNFDLGASSPFINKGKTLTTITRDYLYRVRPGGGTKYDIGAYERP